jgi:hypothetical protein
MPSADYQWGLFFHLAGVIALACATAITYSTFTMMRRAKTVQEVRIWGTLGRIVAQFQVHPIVALELVLSGAYLVDQFHLDWTTGWILFPLITVFVASANGALIISPRMKAIVMTAGPAPDGPVPPRLTARLHDPVLLAAEHANIMMTVAIVWDMATKPGDTAALLWIVAASAVGVASALPAYQRHQRARAAMAQQ